jgi:hypothetical protein
MANSSSWRLASAACVAAAVVTVAVGGTAANAATPAHTAMTGCMVTAPPPARTAATASAVASGAAYKASHDTEAAQQRAASAGSAARDARKNALIRSGRLKLKAPLARKLSCAGMLAGFAPNAVADGVVPDLAQRAQVTGSFCGPATVAEMSATVPGPSPANLDQWTAAAYMDGNGGNTINSNGTDIDWEVNGLNNYVGVPDFGRVYYGYVGMSYNPTAGDRSAFEANLDTDVSQGSPVAGDAWEVVNGPHLVGHPNEEIFHYFEIGGRSGGSTFYADSATSVWSSVPAFSWIDTTDLETILGGRGYIW